MINYTAMETKSKREGAFATSDTKIRGVSGPSKHSGKNPLHKDVPIQVQDCPCTLVHRCIGRRQALGTSRPVVPSLLYVPSGLRQVFDAVAILFFSFLMTPLSC